VLALLDECPVGEHVLDQADHRRCGDAKGESDGPTALEDVGVNDQLLGERIGDVVDAGDLGVVVDPALGLQISLEGAMPVDMVGRDVEAGRGDRRHRPLPMQLEAGQLNGKHVEGLGVQHRFQQGCAHVAGTDRAQPARPQDRSKHVDGRRLAVGAGDREPGGGPGLGPHPPGEFDLSPHRYAVRRRIEQQRVVGPPARRGDDQVQQRWCVRAALPRQGADVLLAQADLRAEDRQDLGSLVDGLSGAGCGTVDDGHVGAAFQQRVGRREPADPEPGDDDPQPRPIGVAMGQTRARLVGVQLDHVAPTTHSA
jgi:hypothetical protein